MTKEIRMTRTTKMTRMASGVQVALPVNQDAQVVSTASAVGAVSKDGCAVGAVVGMSTMIPNMCPPYVQQDDVPSVSTKVGQEDLYAKWCPSWSSIRFQCGKYEDQVGQQQKQGIQTDVREIKEGFKIPC